MLKMNLFENNLTAKIIEFYNCRENLLSFDQVLHNIKTNKFDRSNNRSQPTHCNSIMSTKFPAKIM